MPPCDDCLQRARRHGSYGDVCQSMNNDPLTPLEECGFQMQPLTPPNAQPPPLPGPDDLNFPANNSSRHHPTTEGYCCKHGISTGGSVNNHNPSGTPSLMT